MAKLTKRFMETLKPKEAGDVVVWDDALPGFGVRLKPSGVASYIVQYRAKGVSRRLTIGRHGVLTPEQARREAQKILVEIHEGGDPAQERQDSRHAPTVAELAERYLTEHCEPKNKPRSVSENRRFLEQFILPALGKYRVEAVTRADVAKLHHTMRGTPYQANHVRAVLSKMFSLAEKWGLRPDGSNPVRHVEKFKEYKRERYLSSEELARLGTMLAQEEQADQKDAEDPSVILAIRLLVLTGCRLSEILTLKWEHVDFERRCLRLPDSKTGAKLVALSAAALRLLASAPRLAGNPHVVPGARQGAHLVNLNKAWRRIREKAGLPDVRVHDLRHSFASVGAAAGLGLPIIGALLGHKHAATTHRYAHLAADPLNEAADVIADRIEAAMTARPKVVNLKRNG
ncbi:MAG: tyrosine-type recombinase/integrase [Pseudomonadota bacterium]